MIAIAPTKDAMLFSSTVTEEEMGSCRFGGTKFFVANLTTGEVTETTDYLSVMRNYDAWYIGAREQHASGEYLIRDVVANVVLVRSPRRLGIAAQFWDQPTPAPARVGE